MKRVVMVFSMICLMTTFVMSGEGEGIKFKGLVQAWFSYAEQDAADDSGYGFTLRRVRFTPYGSLTKNIKWTLQAGWDKQEAKLLDAYIDFNFSKGFKIRMGQYTVPGTISSSLTSSGKLDLIERAAITQRWGGNNGLSSYRSMGVQVYGNLLEGKLYYAVMFANTSTSSIFTPSVKSTDYFHEHNGPMVYGRLEAKPAKGLRLGGFFSSGKEEDTDYVRNSYGAHLFYVNKGINFKVEYIGGQYGTDGLETKYSGLYAVLGYTVKKVEPIVRYDFYTPNDGDPDSDGVEKYNNFTLGINYFQSKHVKLQVNYVIRDESMAGGLEKIKNNIFYICCQYTFNY